MKRRWPLIAACVVVFLAVGYWISWINRPLRIRSTGVRSEKGSFFATFELENHSTKTLAVLNKVLLHGDQDGQVYTRVGSWSSLDRSSNVPMIKPGEVCSLKVPLKSALPEDRLPIAPFRVELKVANIRSPVWDSPPLGWLPSRMKPPLQASVWSERVTP